jgi:diacylglycerol kinase family enzyme
MQVTLVHNPAAGDSEHGKAFLMDVLDAAGHQVRYVSTAERSWRDGLQSTADVIAAAGGDGTVAKVARAVRRAPPIAVLPLGTANNIATALGLRDTSIPELVACWPQGRLQPFDIGIVRHGKESSRFVESVGLGLVADAMAAIDASRAVEQLDRATDRIEAAIGIHQRLARDLELVRVELVVDGRDVSGRYVLVEILNFGRVGPNLCLAPHALPADGLLDLVLVDERGQRDLADHLPRYRTDPAGAPPLRSMAARRVSLRCDPRYLHVDDQLHRIETGWTTGAGLHVEVDPQAVAFLV